MTADEIRRRFLEFFASYGHQIVPSDSLIPSEDPTLLFTGSGMNQFKPLFLGKATKFRRAATCQKCLRTQDLANVGKTAGHHTFFEMLGNFSFGDYFKDEAINWAWEFLTQELGLPEDLLWVSVYEDDQEAFDIWKDKVKVPRAKIIKMGVKENFWPSEAPQKGPDGPCGPCSEIFYDQGEGRGCGKPTPLEVKAPKEPTCGPACDCDRFVELWNLVFTEYDRQSDQTLAPLPNKNIDTGMGLERLTALMQAVLNNFETDLFSPIIEGLSRRLGVEYGKDRAETYHLKAISDHLRAITFVIADGVSPSNEGRGFVLRKLIRWAAGHCKYFSGREEVTKPFLFDLIPTVIKAMEVPYPELKAKSDHIQFVVRTEEERFQLIWEEGLLELKRKKEEVGEEPIPGAFMFKLKDTYGFPIDIDSDILTEYTGTLTWDRRGYEEAMALQRERARGGSPIGFEIFAETMASKIRSLGKATKFLGYDEDTCSGTVVSILKNNEETDEAKEGDEVLVVLDQTPFYGEAGGQIGDVGLIRTPKLELKVHDAKKVDDVIVHLGKVLKGTIKVKDKVKASIDKERRFQVMENHTATHLLQAALREVLGSHIQQSGSLVSWDRLRFDFTHYKAITQDELDRIEALVNECIRRNSQVIIEHMSMREAKKARATALFGEKYGELVRVISIDKFSKELCGGIHLTATGQIGLFKIISEGSIASGVRRIEAITGERAYEKVKEEEARLVQISQLIKTKPQEVVRGVKKLSLQLREYEKELDSLRTQLAISQVDDIIKEAIEIQGVKVIARRLEKLAMKDLMKMCDLIRRRVAGAVIVLGSVVNSKVALICAVTKDLLPKKLNAALIVKEIAGTVSGSGGGGLELARAGGKDPSKLNEALGKVSKIVKEYIEESSN